MYEVWMPNGDSAEAEDIDGILLAARTLAEDAAVGYGSTRRLLRDAIVTRDGRYDGLATTIAQVV